MRRSGGRQVWRLSCALLALALTACARPAAIDHRPSTTDGTLRVATHNIHYVDLADADGRWSSTGWLERREALSAAFRTLDADIVAMQEAFARGDDPADRERGPAPAWLARQHPDYAMTGLGRGARAPHAQPIFYRKARFELATRGSFDFSITPHVVDGRGIDDTAPNHATWARLRERSSGRTVTIVNVHLDHRSPLARAHGARLVARFVRPHIERGEAVVMAGDLNARRAAPVVDILKSAGLAFPPVAGATFHFGRGIDVLGAIDHIAHGPALTPLRAPMVLRRRFAGVWPSDHHPVALDLRWP